jgi:hypothetical protein
MFCLLQPMSKIGKEGTSVEDPDPKVFGPPGSGYGNTQKNCEKSSFCWRPEDQ